MTPLPPIGFFGGVTAVGDFESISTVSVGSGGSASISFSSIPTTYKHLQIRWIAKDNRGATADSSLITLNSDTNNSNYHTHRFIGYSGGALSQDFGNSREQGGVNGTSSGSDFGAAIIDILDYANTNKYKTVRGLSGVENNSAGEVGVYSTLWMNTSAITSLTLAPANGSSFNQYSHFALYGIKG